MFKNVVKFCPVTSTTDTGVTLFKDRVKSCPVKSTKPVPITFTLTPQFISAPSVNIILIDSIGCQKVETVICGL